jgi:hypothetical protein
MFERIIQALARFDEEHPALSMLVGSLVFLPGMWAVCGLIQGAPA